MPIKRVIRYLNLFILIAIVFYFSRGIILVIQSAGWKLAYYFYVETLISIPIVLGVLAFLLLNKDNCKFNPVKLLITAVAAEVSCQLLYWGKYYVSLLKCFSSLIIGKEIIARLWIGFAFDIVASIFCAAFFCCALLFSCKIKLESKSVTKTWIIVFILFVLLSAFIYFVYFMTMTTTWGQSFFMGVKVYRFQGIAFKAHTTLRVFTMMLVALWIDCHITKAKQESSVR